MAIKANMVRKRRKNGKRRRIFIAFCILLHGLAEVTVVNPNMLHNHSVGSRYSINVWDIALFLNKKFFGPVVLSLVYHTVECET